MRSTGIFKLKLVEELFISSGMIHACWHGIFVLCLSTATRWYNYGIVVCVLACRNITNLVLSVCTHTHFISRTYRYTKLTYTRSRRIASTPTRQMNVTSNQNGNNTDKKSTMDTCSTPALEKSSTIYPEESTAGTTAGNVAGSGEEKKRALHRNVK